MQKETLIPHRWCGCSVAAVAAEIMHVEKMNVPCSSSMNHFLEWLQILCHCCVPHHCRTVQKKSIIPFRRCSHGIALVAAEIMPVENMNVPHRNHSIIHIFYVPNFHCCRCGFPTAVEVPIWTGSVGRKSRPPAFVVVFFNVFLIQYIVICPGMTHPIDWADNRYCAKRFHSEMRCEVCMWAVIHMIGFIHERIHAEISLCAGHSST